MRFNSIYIGYIYVCVCAIECLMSKLLIRTVSQAASCLLMEYLE